MRPYFFRKPAVTEDRQAIKYQARQRRAAAIKKAPKPGLFRRIVRALTPRNLTAADRAAIYEAQNKRARRQARNIRWWSTDRTWEFYGRAR